MVKLSKIAMLFLFCSFFSDLAAQADWETLMTEFRDPPIEYRPHTRWWWPMSVTKEEITWELEQMHAHGIGGVEQITMQRFYEKGNVSFMSAEFIDLLKHMVFEAKRLGMKVSINFGGPGWIIGGDWVPENERSKDIVPTSIIVTGPALFDQKLPTKLTKTKRSWEKFTPKLSGDEKLLAVVAGKIENKKIDEKSLQILTDYDSQNLLKWQIPDGQWRIMAFWLKTNPGEAVDHFSEKAMQHYCEDFGGKLYQAFGAEFGKTVESMFADSFELPNSASGIYWSDDLLEQFQKSKKYDVTKYLPAIWWDVGDISPKIRFDVNEFLHQQGLNAFFKTFTNWCAQHNVKARIQPYGLTTDNIEAAGMTHIPEMEITPGEKDQHPWFDTRIGPKKYVASGAHIYGRKIITTEAYTFMHWERYRSTLQELKIASDGYLRSGATKFYNHGYSYSPERDIAPSRTIGFAALLNHQNILWKYYPLLAEYVARCAVLLQKGDFAPDIAIYSPLANQWTKVVLNARKWTREFDWGELGHLLISNGYDFDLLNDDALQNMASVADGKLKVGNLQYQALLLPNIESMPLKTLNKIEKYIKSGGQVITLDNLPNAAVGFENSKENDSAVQEIVQRVFDQNGKKNVGKGTTWFVENVIHRPIWWDNYASAFDPFLTILRGIIAPDFSIDFAQHGLRKNDGLTFYHRKFNGSDIYFVANIQDTPVSLPVIFRVQNSLVEKWNPLTGYIEKVHHFVKKNSGIQLPVNLQAYESTIYIFHPRKNGMHVTASDFSQILSLTREKISVVAEKNGIHQITIRIGNKSLTKESVVNGIPAVMKIAGPWQLTLKNGSHPIIDKKLHHLTSWTTDSLTKNFSGTGKYETDFSLTGTFLQSDNRLLLDLGRVCNVAEVYVNTEKSGIIWMPGQSLDITKLVRKGQNTLVVLVTNTLINRVAAMKKNNPVPNDLIPQLGQGVSDRLPREYGFKPLPASGLLGPVEIKVQKIVEINL
ncbi:MAG: hypothetical protein DWQ05_11340 [Calditrichaeota bacterium]|nr:MAG: hypothetical protein DWQ05_11340 [Calditrichota bacterium]